MSFKPMDWLVSCWYHRVFVKWRWVQKSLFIFFFILSLASFFHFREIHVDHLELGTVTQKYVLAQVGFDFTDVETTRVLKEESLRDIGRIYYFDDEEIFKIERQVHNDLIRDPQWRNEFASTTFDDLVHACELIHDVLLKSVFSDDRTIQKLIQMGLASKQCLMKAGTMSSIWDQIEQKAFVSLGAVSRFVLEKYRQHSWSLKEDFNLRQCLRRKIKEEIPIKKTRIEAGSRIINAGDEVTSRHLDMLQEMKKALAEERHLLKPLTILGSVALAAILTFLGLYYFRGFHPWLLKSFSKLALVAMVILLTLCLAKITEYVILYKSGHLFDICRLPIFALFASMTISILIDRNVALFVSGFITLVLGVTLAMESDEFLIINLSTAVMAIVWTKDVRKRKDIFVICTKIWLLTLPLILAINLLSHQFWHRQVLTDFLTTFLFIFVIGILVIAILPLLESIFGIVTDLMLMEVGDPNHTLLRRLSLEAPGTYQHSLGVASLAEEAARAIGASALLCRVGSLYHDIGKIAQPQYFSENQLSGFDMHQLLTPLESAQVIIQHVTDGIKLAESCELPRPIIEMIQQHHGTTLVYYFYHAQIEKNRAKAIEVEEGFFRYPGPIPQSRESAVVMLADSIEAAYRSQDEVSEKAIAQLVEGIVSDKIREHQLDASQLTFEDLKAIKKAMFRSLMALGHSRAKYPAPVKAPVPIPSEVLV